jgi:hypothetical protein
MVKRSKRLAGLERELAKWFSLEPPKPRRRRLTKAEVQAQVVQGCLDYLDEVAARQSDEARVAQRVLEEVTSIPEQLLAEAALFWAEQLLKANLQNGERVFRLLRARVPEQIGRAYGLFRVFPDHEGWALEDLVTEYDWLRRGD